MENIETVLKKIVEILKARPEVLAVYLFGSYAKGYAREDSDVDIGVVTPSSYKKKDVLFMYGLQSDLQDELAASSLEKKVDLVVLGNVPVTLQSEIISGRPLLVKDEQKLVEEIIGVSNSSDDLDDYVELRRGYNVAKARGRLGIL